MDSKGRVESSLKDLGGTFEDMQSQFDEGFKLLTTSLGEGVVSGEDAQPFGTQYENESMQQKPSGGVNLSSTQKQALGILSKYESAGSGGYNAVNQIGIKGGRGVMGYSGDFTRMSQHGGRPLTDLTIAEIMALQAKRPGMSNQEWIRQGRLHAVGRYQFIGGTLPGVVKRSGIPINAKFTPEVQDLLALQYLKEAGIGAWIGPSDKATREERMVIEGARKEPINYKPPISSGSSQQQSQIPSTPRPAQTAPSTSFAPVTGTTGASMGNKPLSVPYSPFKPGSGAQLTSGKGLRWGRMHKGYDIAAKTGTPLYAYFPGKVTHMGLDGTASSAGYGNWVVWKDDIYGAYHFFGHMRDRPAVRVGQVISQGTLMGYVGSTGNSTGPHLHWEISNNPPQSNGQFTSYEDPGSWLRKHPLKSAGPGVITTPTQAQITPSGTQQRQQASQQLAQQQVGPSIVILEEEPPPQSQGSFGGGGAMMIPIIINPLNSFITKKLLLDLAYT
jgi:murein DD-endopeptidase MepM/ murein hydrolase activator NlpD